MRNIQILLRSDPCLRVLIVNVVCYKPDSCLTTNFALSDENMKMIMDDIEEGKAAEAASEFEVEGKEDDNEDSDEDNGVTHKRVDGHEVDEEDEDLCESNIMYLSQNILVKGYFELQKILNLI